MMDTVFCCQTIPGIVKLGTTYKVIEWITHKYGCDPVVACDDGQPRLIWRGLFHD
jgi:hypothetical protein